MFSMPFTVETEIGIEKRCLSCGEYWPADTEFFEFNARRKDRLSPRCIACIKAGNWGRRMPETRARFDVRTYSCR